MTGYQPRHRADVIVDSCVGLRTTPCSVCIGRGTGGAHRGLVMARDWQPGDVAIVKVDGKWRTGMRCGWAGRNLWWRTGAANASDREIEDIRPVAVIDPEDEAQVGRLMDLIRSVNPAKVMSDDELRTVFQEALREFADPTPPRMDEPGTWGVVEASAKGNPRRRYWTKTPNAAWWSVNGTSTATWNELIDPAPVRDGVEP